VGAVALVDDDGVGDVGHGDVLKGDVGRAAPRRPRPRLDAHPVGGALHRAVPDDQPAHVLLALVLAQAPHAEPVAGAAGDAADDDVDGAGADGHAVVAGADDRVEDADVARVADVDAVRVAAGGRRVDAEALRHDPGAAAQVHVEAPAVHERQASQRRVRHVLENQGLQHNGRRADHLAISSTKEKGSSLFRFVYRRLGLGLATPMALAVEGAVAGDEEVVEAAERDPGIVREVAAAAARTRRLEHAMDHHGGRVAVRARPLELHGADGECALGEHERGVAGGGAARRPPRGQESLHARFRPCRFS
jgi:hypothetical protein